MIMTYANDTNAQFVFNTTLHNLKHDDVQTTRDAIVYALNALRDDRTKHADDTRNILMQLIVQRVENEHDTLCDECDIVMFG